MARHRRRSRGGGGGSGLPIGMIVVVLVIGVAGFMLYKKMKGQQQPVAAMAYRY